MTSTERDLLIEPTESGLAAARARAGSVVDVAASPWLSSAETQRLYDLRGVTIEQIARAVSSNSSTVYRYVDVEGRRVSDSVDRRHRHEPRDR